MTDFRALCARMADELDHYRQLLMDDRREVHALAAEARAALSQPEPAAEALAARPLLEEMAKLADVIDQATVGRIIKLATSAETWLRNNPPGQPIAIEPRGCPAPGACGCVVPAPPAEGEVAELVANLRRFIVEHGKMRGLDPEVIYSIQEGIEGREAHLTISGLRRMADLLERQQPAPFQRSGTFCC